MSELTKPVQPSPPPADQARVGQSYRKQGPVPGCDRRALFGKFPTVDSPLPVRLF
jgi:hypothetical protein